MIGHKGIIVVKYGGSSLKTADDFYRVADHQKGLHDTGYRSVCVNSARSGVSDRLLKVWRRELPLKDYADQEEAFYADGVFNNHPKRDAFMEDYRAGGRGLADVLQEGREPDSHRESYVLAHGEAEAGTALQYLMRELFSPELTFLDGHEAGVVATRMRGPVDIKASVDNLKKHMKGDHSFGGFVGLDPKNRHHYLLLDRNSTDVTAALVAAAFGAEEYVNIKDVPGVYPFDPSFCADAERPPVIKNMSYAEAANTSRNGSPVLHPTGIIVSDKYGVMIRVTSIENGSNGTLISDVSGTTEAKPYAAISSALCGLVTVNDQSMDIPGTGRGYAAQVLEVISDAGFDTLLPSGPGNTMSVVVAGGNEVTKGRGVNLAKLSSAVKRGLMRDGRDDAIVRPSAVGYISITGAAMARRPGTVTEIFRTLDDAGIRYFMASQGDDDVLAPVVSFCVDPKDYRGAVNALRKLL